MPVRIVEGQLPYTGGTGIEIDSNKVISLLLREENNLILVNGDNELYTDLQLVANIKPSDDFPVGVTTGKILQSDGWTQSGLLLNWKTTSGDYARWIYANDGKIYFDNGTGTWKQVYYSSEVDNLIQTLRNYVDATYQPKLTAGTGINIDSNDVISNTLPGAIVSATAPSNPTEGMVWYDTTNDVLKTYDGTNWNIVGDEAADINTKTFFISGTAEEKKAKLGQAIQYYLNGKNPILSLGNTTYILRDVVVGDFELGTNDVYTFSSTIKSENGKFWEIVVDVLVTAQGHGSTVSSFTDTKHSAGAVVSGAAPSNPAQGDLWYDTTNDEMKVYDGSQWNSVGTGGGGNDIVYATQAEYNALLPGAASDGKHYFIYSTSGGGGWQPGANTLVYYEFNNSLSDSSGNNVNLTNQGTISYVSNPNAVVLGNSNYLYATSFSDDWEHDWTLNVWVNITTRSGGPSFIASAGTNSSYAMVIPCISSSGYTQFSIYGEDNIGTIPTSTNTWYNIVYTYNYSTRNYKTYVNGVKDLDGTLNQQYNISSSYLYIGAMANELAQTNFRLKGKLSKYILEDKEWDATKISYYFDLTKGDYGIS